MKLEEALKLCKPTQCLKRKKWRKNSSLLLLTSAKTIEELNVELTPDSLIADDWDICEIES